MTEFPAKKYKTESIKYTMNIRKKDHIREQWCCLHKISKTGTVYRF